MNELNTTKSKAEKNDSLETAVSEWISSDAGHIALSRALEEAKHATSLLERECQVKRERLHEPVTV